MYGVSANTPRQLCYDLLSTCDENPVKLHARPARIGKNALYTLALEGGDQDVAASHARTEFAPFRALSLRGLWFSRFRRFAHNLLS